MQVELVTHNPPGSISGIGRYVRELHRHLEPHIDVRFASEILPPFVKQLSVLQHFPVGIAAHQRGSIVHFPQIMGCAQMLWHPVRPSVATVHDLGVLVRNEDAILFDRISRAVLQIQFKGLSHIDRFAVNSERTRRDLVEKLNIDEKRIEIVQNGVELETFRVINGAREQIAQKYNIQPIKDGFDLIYVGSELPRKNVKLLLQAVAKLKALGYSVRLLKIGGAGGESCSVANIRWK